MTGSGSTYKVLLLPGDGVGPEVVDEARETLDLAAALFGFGLEYTEGLLGGAAIDAYGTSLRDEEIAVALDSDSVLMGAVGGPQWDNVAREVRPEAGLLRIRAALGLFANLRPIRVFDVLADASPLKPEIVRGVDLIIVRELTGGLYFGKPSEQRTTSEGREAIDTLIYREHEITRLVELGFQLAANRRKKVTSVDKANVMASSRLWREITNEIAMRHPDIKLEHALVDSTAMKLISRPGDFDVMVMENMFGDILSDEAAVLAGSLGMLPSASLSGKKPVRAGTVAEQFGMYEPIHGSAPDIAGKGIANPSGAILSAAMMLRVSFGQVEAADAIEEAVAAALAAGARTADVAGSGASVSTAEFGKAVRDELTKTMQANSRA